MTYWIWVTATLIGYTMSSGLWATTDPWAVCRGPCIILIACCLHLNSTRECWVGSRHPLPCMPTTMVSRFCTARPLGWSDQALPRAYETIVPQCQGALLLLSNKIGRIMLFWISLKLCWMRDRHSLGDWNHSFCFACRLFNYPLCWQQGCCQRWKRSHFRDVIITALSVQGKTQLDDVLFHIYATKF